VTESKHLKNPNTNIEQNPQPQSQTRNPKPLSFPLQIALLLISHHHLSLDGAANHAGETPFQLAGRLHGLRAQAFFEYVYSRAEISSSSSAAAESTTAASTAAAAAASEADSSSAVPSAALQSVPSSVGAEHGVESAFVFEMYAFYLIF
jgi:hypothetical protein